MSEICRPGLFSAKKNATSSKKDSDEEKLYHEFQVGRPDEIIWKSHGSELHDSVELSKCLGEPEFWRFERKKTDDLWSFHVRSAENGEKLFVSYDAKSHEPDDITLELADDSTNGKKRFFEILVQGEGYLIRAQNTLDRYIRSNDGKLEMFTMTTELPEKCMQWFIGETIIGLEKQGNPPVVEIMSNSQVEISDEVSCGNIPHHQFQVAHPSGIKWISERSRLHDSVTLSMNVGKPEHWRFERQEDEPLWSVHVLSIKGEKLYVSYDERSDDITLELKDDSSIGKKRFFLILVQDNGLYHFRAQNIRDKYIGRSNDGNLKMSTTSVKWLIKETLDTLEGQERDVVVEVMDNSRKWISTKVSENQPILVSQKGDLENWKLHTEAGGVAEKWTFSPINKSTLFASSTTTRTLTPDKILLEGQLQEAPNLIQFTTRSYEGKNKLQNVSTSKWLAVSDDDNLILKLDDKLAVDWNIILSDFK